MSRTTELTNPLSLIRGLEKTPQYLSSLHSGDRQRALGTTARFFAEKMGSAERQTEQDRINAFSVRILSTLPDFIQSSRQLDAIEEQEQHEGRRVARRDKIPHLRNAIPFNHVLRDLIDSFQDISPKNIVDFCTVAGLDMDDSRDAQYLQTKVRECLVGMQYEIGLEQILWNIEEVEDVQHADEDQELQGIDVIVTYRGEKLALDAKASEKGAAKALLGREEAASRKRLRVADTELGGYPLWSGINFEDFGGGFRVDETTIKRCTPKVARTLEMLYRSRRGQDGSTQKLA